ncbi:MAG TPA: DNA polymerase III subunit delta [Chitinophagaceae bacterium]|nr:DNA polymerase III subunit delta [Chitinophagaceae bacterium]
MTFDALMKELKEGQYRSLYLLQGEEEYFIDQACDFFEHKLLSEAEQDFNLSIFYGKDADWSDVINACRRYPMFSEKQVVLLKEAQSMRKQDLEKLKAYVEDLQDSTIFVITFKGGKVDGRSAFGKKVKEKGTILYVKKLYENQLPGWIRSYVQSKGYDISEKACMMMASHVGMDLSVQTNEIGKIILNIPEGSTIDDKAVEQFVGISREYNVFEFQNAIGKKDVPKLMRIIRYFEGNPKAAPMQLLLPVLYNYFSKTEALLQHRGKSGAELAKAIGVSPYFLRDYQQGARLYGINGVRRAILLLYKYNQRLVGINDNSTSQSDLLKELMGKILQD